MNVTRRTFIKGVAGLLVPAVTGVEVAEPIKRFWQGWSGGGGVREYRDLGWATISIPKNLAVNLVSGEIPGSFHPPGNSYPQRFSWPPYALYGERDNWGLTKVVHIPCGTVLVNGVKNENIVESVTAGRLADT